jgi:biopolymer transport protein ExbB/TolQ
MDWRLQLAQHAAERAATRVHGELARGVDGLATVAATVPFLGFLWTIWALRCNTFKGFDGDQATGIGMVAYGLSQSLFPTALALGLAIVATWAHRHVRTQLAAFDLEMRHAAETLPALMCYLNSAADKRR